MEGHVHGDDQNGDDSGRGSVRSDRKYDGVRGVATASRRTISGSH
jgi:hypothetical protein